MKQLLSQYHYKLPVYLVKHLQKNKYNPEEFLDWYIKFPNLTAQPKLKRVQLTTKSTVLVIFCYYFWIAYIFSALVVLDVNVPVGLVGIAISPFLVGGIVYAIAYILNKYSNLSKKPRKPLKK